MSKKSLYFVFTVAKRMNKNKKTLEERRKYVKEQMKRRHKSETTDMCAKRLAKELFLSESTIWKDFLN